MREKLIASCLLVLTLLSAGGIPLEAQIRTYDPLYESSRIEVRAIDLSVKDLSRAREIPVKIYLPSGKEAYPVILFSHGLGGSKDNCEYLGKHWAMRRYVSVFLQHPGSDSAIWKDKPVDQVMTSMTEAASLYNFLQRIRDVNRVLDQLDSWNATEKHPLFGRMDMSQVGMSGHSFGALTAQAVGGQIFPGETKSKTQTYTDPRIKAVIALSPSNPRSTLNTKRAFGGVKIPWLLMTGTKDTAPSGDADLKSRLAVFTALPDGGKYELVLNGADHSAFTERMLPWDQEERNPNHHKAISAISTAFWDTWLRSDFPAKSWLDGNGPLQVLEAKDRWQKK